VTRPVEPSADIADSDQAKPSTRTRLLRVVLPRVLIVLVLAAVVVIVWRNRHGLQTAVDEVGVRDVLLSFVFAVAGTACIERIWASVLRALGPRVPAREAGAMFYVSQLGKYLPGSVWPILAQMEFGRRHRVGRRLMVSANLLMLAVVAATGLLAGAVFLPWASADGLRRYWWTLLLLVPLIVMLQPRVLTRLLNLAFRLSRGEPLTDRIDARLIGVAAAWGLLVWVLLGAHLFILTHALGASGHDGAAAAVGGIGLAFAAGLIFIPAPAGAGIRDAILVATFGPQIGTTNALAVALASRVLLIGADVLLAAVGAATAAYLRRRTSPV
jgi:glycosyltransferase 2 family protein